MFYNNKPAEPGSVLAQLIERDRKASAEAFATRVERDSAEDFASEIAGDLRQMRTRAERAEQMLKVERERCALVALEQRCERGTAWDLACLAIAKAIMQPTRYERGLDPWASIPPEAGFDGPQGAE